MRIAVIGGGPGGLYFAALAKQLGPDHEITVWERNRSDDTFGFGVVFSDETLGGIEHADPASTPRWRRSSRVWDDIDVHFGGEVITSGGHGFAAMSRRRLLEILQARCRELGVDGALRDRGAGRRGAGGAVRPGRRRATGSTRASGRRTPSRSARRVETRRCRYMWLGTDQGVRRVHVRGARDAVRRDADPRLPVRRARQHVHHRDARRRLASARASTDLAPTDLAPGESDEKSIARGAASCSPTSSTATR